MLIKSSKSKDLRSLKVKGKTQQKIEHYVKKNDHYLSPRKSNQQSKKNEKFQTPTKKPKGKLQQAQLRLSDKKVKIYKSDTPTKYLSTAATQKSSRGRPKKFPEELTWVYDWERKSKLEAKNCIQQIYHSAGKSNFTGIQKIDPLQYLKM